MSSTSPTQRTLQYLRSRGWSAWVVEKWIERTKQRIDLFGFGDVLAFRGSVVLIVQATTQAHAAERQAKIGANEIARLWRTENRLVWVIAWRKLKGRGRRQWFPSVREWMLAGEWTEEAFGGGDVNPVLAGATYKEPHNG